MHTKSCRKKRCQLMCAWTVSFSTASVIIPAMVMWSRGCCCWRAASVRPVKLCQQSPYWELSTEQRSLRKGQTEAHNPSTATNRDHFQMGYGKWIYMVWITSFTCAQHPIFSLRRMRFSRKWSKTPLLNQAIHQPFGKMVLKSTISTVIYVILIFGLCQCGLFLCGKRELFRCFWT